VPKEKIVGSEETVVAELKKIPGVINASYTFNNMVGRNFGNYGIEWEGRDPNGAIYFEGFGSGYDFIETYGNEDGLRKKLFKRIWRRQHKDHF
jgi:hypothetical protein